MISFQWFLFGDRSREISTILKSLQDLSKVSDCLFDMKIILIQRKTI